MPIVDYALAYDFVDPASPDVPYRLEFRYAYREDEDPRPHLTNPNGQLVAVVKGRHPQRGTVEAVTRSGVPFNSIEQAIDRDQWPWHSPGQVDLDQIRERIRAAGLT